MVCNLASRLLMVYSRLLVLSFPIRCSCRGKMHRFFLYLIWNVSYISPPGSSFTFDSLSCAHACPLELMELCGKVSIREFSVLTATMKLTIVWHVASTDCLLSSSVHVQDIHICVCIREHNNLAIAQLLLYTFMYANTFIMRSISLKDCSCYFTKLATIHIALLMIYDTIHFHFM